MSARYSLSEKFKLTMKMKKYIYMALTLLAVTACSNEDAIFDSGKNPNVSVVDGGYQGKTRASEEGMATVFTQGDKIGVFAVENGVVVPGVDNLCLTATATEAGLDWIPAGGAALPQKDGIAYYAYYPYRESLPAAVNPAADNAGDFFGPLASAWSPAADQSDYKDYTASDLMTAKGVVASDGISFTMAHRMTLVMVTFPEARYVFTNEPAIPDYVITTTTDIVFNDIKPYLRNGTFAILVNPAKSNNVISGSYGTGADKRKWEFTPSDKPGTANTYNIDGEKNLGVISHNLQIGDFFLADGRLLSKDATDAEVAAADIVGIVYNIDPSRIGKAEKEVLGGVAHASVFSVKYAENDGKVLNFVWGAEKRDDSTVGIPEVVGANSLETCRKADAMISGLEVLQNIMKNDKEKYESGHYEAFKLATEHGMTHSSYKTMRARTTGWYLPAPGQIHDVVRNLGKAPISFENVSSYNWADTYIWEKVGTPGKMIDAAMKKIKASGKDEIGAQSCFFWTAAQSGTDYGCTAAIGDGTTLSSLNCTPQPKTSFQYAVRPVLTF